MLEIQLLRPIEMSWEQVQQIVAQSVATGEEIDLEIPIYGQLYFTDTRELASQFVMAAYVGESLFSACERIKCYLPASVASHESVGFVLLPKSVEAFMEKLWEAIAAYLPLADDDDGMGAWDANEEAWDLYGKPAGSLHFPELLAHAEQMLAAVGKSLDDDDDE